jgi:hypothetical protein
MTLALTPFNSTQYMGLLGFVAAAASSLLASQRTRSVTRQLWRGIAAVLLVCSAEVLLGWRHRLHLFINVVLEVFDLYRFRLAIQLVVIAGVVAWLVRVYQRAPPREHLGVPAATAASAAAGLLALFAIETTSVHFLDAVLYARAGPVVLIGWLWLLLAGVIVVAALRAAWNEGQARTR